MLIQKTELLPEQGISEQKKRLFGKYIKMSLLFFENRMIIILLRKGCAVHQGRTK